MPQVIIRHPETKAEYEISTADYRRGKHAVGADGELTTFADAGYEIVCNADGSPYKPAAAAATSEPEPEPQT
jgi:hypothetical protein